MPGFLLYTTFIAWPMFNIVWYSLNHYSRSLERTFIGFENYVRLFSGQNLERVLNALWNNFKIIAAFYIVGIPLALLFAYLIDSKVFGHRFYKTIIFIPYILNYVIVGFMLLILFDPQIGVINQFFVRIGQSQLRQAWIGDQRYALLIIIIGYIWKGMGFNTMLFLANMQIIPHQLLEAAKVDGANSFKTFRHITLPLLTPSLTNASIIAFMAGIQAFEMNIAAQFGLQGNPNYSTDVMGLFYYRTAFGAGENGYGMGSAIVMLQFIIIFAVALLQIRYFRKKEWQED